MSKIHLSMITLTIISSLRMTQHNYNSTDLKQRFIKSNCNVMSGACPCVFYEDVIMSV